MQIEVKRTFIEIVDKEAFKFTKRRDSAPALLTGMVAMPVTSFKSHNFLQRACNQLEKDLNEDHTISVQPKTTVIIRNVPPAYNRDMLLELLDGEGFACKYNFVYLPIKIKWNNAFGYAFVNFCTEAIATDFLHHFTNFNRWGVPHNKVADVDWTREHQGLENQVERYRDSPMMQLESPDEMKPIVLQDGKRVPFPESRRLVRAESKSSSKSTCVSWSDSVSSNVDGPETLAVDRKKQRNHTWGHFENGVVETYSPRSCTLSTSELSDGSEEQHKIRAQKKVERSVKRIKSKLLKLGYSPNL